MSTTSTQPRIYRNETALEGSRIAQLILSHYPLTRLDEALDLGCQAAERGLSSYYVRELNFEPFAGFYVAVNASGIWNLAYNRWDDAATRADELNAEVARQALLGQVAEMPPACPHCKSAMLPVSYGAIANIECQNSSCRYSVHACDADVLAEPEPTPPAPQPDPAARIVKVAAPGLYVCPTNQWRYQPAEVLQGPTYEAVVACPFCKMAHFYSRATREPEPLSVSWMSLAS